MKGTFKNLDKKNNSESSELCMHDHVDRSNVKISNIEKSKIHSSRLLVEKKYLDLKAKKNNRSSTPPYIDPTPEEIIYLPIAFHQFRSEDAFDYSSIYPHLSHHIIDTETYTDAFYIKVVEYLNSFLAGTHADPNIGTLGNLKDNADHGVVSKLRFVIAPKIPQSYFLNFLNTETIENLPDAFGAAFDFEEVIEETESIYALYDEISFSDFSQINNITGFNYSNTILEQNLSDAHSNLQNAQQSLTFVYNSYIEQGETPNTSLELATNESNIKFFEYLTKIGGLIDCGPNGAIFTYNVSKYKPCNLNILNLVATSSNSTCEDITCVNNLDSYGSCGNPRNGSILGVAGVRKYFGFGDFEAEELGNWGNSLPVANVYTTLGKSSISSFFRGYGPPPNMSISGSVFMNNDIWTYMAYQDRDFSAYGYAQVLLHEFGHSFGLPHTFQGGAIHNLHDKVFPNFNFKNNTFQAPNESLGVAVVNFNLPTIPYTDYLAGIRKNIFATNVVKETIYFSDIIHNNIYYSRIFGYEGRPHGVLSRGQDNEFPADTIFLPVKKLENIEGDNMHIAVTLALYGVQITSPENDSVAFLESTLDSVAESILNGSQDFILANPGDTLTYVMHVATFAEALVNGVENPHLANFTPGIFSIRTCNFIPSVWASNRSEITIPNLTSNTFSIKRNNNSGPFNLKFKAEVVQFWDSSTISDPEEVSYDNPIIVSLAEELLSSFVVLEGVTINEDSTEQIEIIKTWANEINVFRLERLWDEEYHFYYISYEGLITKPFDSVRIRSVQENEIHFMEFTCLAVPENSSRTLTDNRILLDDRGNSYLSQDEKTFIDLFYSLTYSNSNNKKLKFSKTSALGKLTNSYQENFSSAEINKQTTIRDSLFQLPFFYDGSVDESQINDKGNASLVFNKILNLYKNINATDFELRGGISTTLIDETRSATISYINEDNNWVLSSSTFQTLNYQAQANRYTPILGSGFQADYEKIFVGINTYNLDYTPTPNTTKLILELENPARPIAIKEYFTDNEGNSLGTKISNTFFWGAYTDADSLGFLNGKPNPFPLLSNADNSNYVGTELGPNVTLEFDITDVTSSIEIIVADMPATHAFLTTKILSASIVRNSRPINTLTRMPFCELDADGNPTDVFDEFWDFNLNWLNEDYPAYPDNWPTDKAYDEFDDNGNSLCPCLYAVQKYQDIKIYSNINEETGEELQEVVLTSIITDGTLEDLNSALATISSNGESNAHPAFKSVYAPSALSFFGEDGVSLYQNGYYNFSEPKFSFANGHSPLFGFYGFSPLQGMPSKYNLDIGNLNNLDFYTRDDLLSDTPRIQKIGSFGLSEISFRYYIGSSDPQSLNYNPYKINENTNVNNLPSFNLDLVPKDEENNNNPIINLPTSTGVYNANMMRHCMNYNVSVQNVSEGQIQYNQATTMYVLRTAYSVEGILRIEAIVEAGRGKWGKIVNFGKILGLGADTVYSGSRDAQNTLEEIENYIESSDNISGCMDPSAVNYDSLAIYDDNSCMYPGPDCIFPEGRIIVCDTGDPLFICNYISEEILDLFVGESTVSQVIYTDEYPEPPEGCTGGGFRYMKSSTLIVAGNPDGAATACKEGNAVNENCVAGLNAPAEDFLNAVLNSEFTLLCDDKATKLTENNYTYGDRYFNKDGKSYQGLYCTRGQDFVYSGSLKERGERLYKPIDITKTYKDSNSLKDVAKNFDRIRKNIQNICKFVKL